MNIARVQGAAIIPEASVSARCHPANAKKTPSVAISGTLPSVATGPLSIPVQRRTGRQSEERRTNDGPRPRNSSLPTDRQPFENLKSTRFRKGKAD
jgi:hypothetical protein